MKSSEEWHWNIKSWRLIHSVQFIVLANIREKKKYFLAKYRIECALYTREYGIYPKLDIIQHIHFKIRWICNIFLIECLAHAFISLNTKSTIIAHDPSLFILAFNRLPLPPHSLLPFYHRPFKIRLFLSLFQIITLIRLLPLSVEICFCPAPEFHVFSSHANLARACCRIVGSHLCI